MATCLVFHEFASVFPLMEGDELSALAESIKASGLREPICKFEGKILDGRNRQTACLMAGVTPVYREFTGTREAALRLVWDENFNRRQLNSSQKAACTVEFETRHNTVVDEMRAEAEARKAQAAGKPRGSKKASVSQQIDSETNDRRTDSKLASLTGTNRQYVADARKIAKDAPEQFEKVKRGEKTITQVKREAKDKKRDERRRANVSKVKSSSKLEDIDGKFATIVIDPPWDWGDEGDIEQLGRARPTYGTMSIDEIERLDVARLSDVDCHIYLWITNRSLPKGFRLLDAWGFRYITCLTWCKPFIGMGNYFRGASEQVLFGVKGSQPLLRKDVGTWFQYSRGDGGHSSKPSEFFDLVESCSPGPYLEMFAREQRNGWFCWGADV